MARITGLLGVLAVAKDRGLIPAVMPVVEQLRQSAGCRFSEAIVEQTRREVGE